ncbi:MAG: hypothetical protein ACTSR8_22250 [Promethearchaeota archaeon]
MLQGSKSDISLKEEQLKDMEEKLKKFILNNADFYNLANKYTFQYREFSSIADYCELKWNRKSKEWELIEYYCHNVDLELPSKKKNTFYLSLSIPEYSWGSLFNEMERRFNENLDEMMGEEEKEEFIENQYEKYVQMRDLYFRDHKMTIIGEWFELSENSIFEYLNRELLRLRETILIKKKISY